MPTQRL